MRKLLFTLVAALAVAAAFAGTASAHTCSNTGITVQSIAPNDIKATGTWQCGTGTGGNVTRTITWQYYTGNCSPFGCEAGGQWVALSSPSGCSGTIFAGPSSSGQFTCQRNFLNKAFGKCVRARFVVVHVTTMTRFSQQCVITRIST